MSKIEQTNKHDCIKNFLPIQYTFITITVILDGTLLIKGSKKIPGWTS